MKELLIAFLKAIAALPELFKKTERTPVTPKPVNPAPMTDERVGDLRRRTDKLEGK